VWATRLEELVDDAGLRARLSGGAVQHAAGFGWDATVDRLQVVYAEAMASAAVPPGLAG
jgi:D-inositol-3-phosphate glycosyltransferase